jgi:hypothetical protein
MVLCKLRVCRADIRWSRRKAGSGRDQVEKYSCSFEGLKAVANGGQAGNFTIHGQSREFAFIYTIFLIPDGCH